MTMDRNNTGDNRRGSSNNNRRSPNGPKPTKEQVEKARRELPRMLSPILRGLVSPTAEGQNKLKISTACHSDAITISLYSPDYAQRSMLIGKEGSTAKALQHIFLCLGNSFGVRLSIVINEEESTLEDVEDDGYNDNDADDNMTK